MTTIEVISPGPLTTIQDLGRPGWAHIGVPRSGAVDRESLKLANLLVGNEPGAAALETTLAGPRLRFGGGARVALSGARVDARVGARLVPMNTAVEVVDGEILRVGNAKSGLRTYIALAGGICARRVLGSAATDTLTGLGPAPLQPGDLLRVEGGTTPNPTGAGMAGASSHQALTAAPTLQVLLGPREDWFTADALKRLTNEPFTVTPASNRIGLRLNGPPLERARNEELPSEGMVPGALQVPPGGQPILLLADHPTTGGYPVVAVVIDADLPVAAQLRPGQQLRFAVGG
jgi:biotin-dependent carboxylase-like uncharacterized protein